MRAVLRQYYLNHLLLLPITVFLWYVACLYLVWLVLAVGLFIFNLNWWWGWFLLIDFAFLWLFFKIIGLVFFANLYFLGKLYRFSKISAVLHFISEIIGFCAGIYNFSLEKGITMSYLWDISPFMTIFLVIPVFGIILYTIALWGIDTVKTHYKWYITKKIALQQIKEEDERMENETI